MKTTQFLSSAIWGLFIVSPGCGAKFIPIGSDDAGTGVACSYNNVSHAVGTSFPSADGCNTCSCSSYGQVACTEMACGNQGGAGPSVGSPGTGGAPAGGMNSTSPTTSPCSLLGSWNTVSAPWLDLSTASVITFDIDGTFTGVPQYWGQYAFDGTTLNIWNGSGADMNCKFEAQWSVVFAPSCGSATLVPAYDNCTGARRYLDWNVSLVRN